MKPFFILFLFSLLCAEENTFEAPNAAVSTVNQKDVIMIDPKLRAQDFIEAYELIKRGKSPQKVMFHLSDGKTLTNVVEMHPMKNGTLLLFKIITSLGNQYELIPVERLITISHL